MTRTLARPAIRQGPIDLHAAAALEADEVLELLASGRDGLGAEEAARRLAELGPNVSEPTAYGRSRSSPASFGATCSSCSSSRSSG